MEIIEDAAGIRLRETVPRVIKVANPGVNTEWSINVPGGVLWTVLSITALLTTDANAANRTPVITFSDGSDVFARVPPAAVVPASTAARYTWSRNIGVTSSASLTAGQIAPLPAIPIFGGFAIASATENRQAGDVYTAVALYVLETEELPYDVELNQDLAALVGKTSRAYPFVPLGV